MIIEWCRLCRIGEIIRGMPLINSFYLFPGWGQTPVRSQLWSAIICAQAWWFPLFYQTWKKGDFAKSPVFKVGKKCSNYHACTQKRRPPSRPWTGAPRPFGHQNELVDIINCTKPGGRPDLLAFARSGGRPDQAGPARRETGLARWPPKQLR